MNRNQFIKNIALLGAMLPLEFTYGSNGKILKNFGTTDIEEATIEMLQKMMQNGNITAESLTRMYLNRISRLDKAGPVLNSIIELNPDAISIAQKMDLERKSGKVRGKLHGIPMLIKDNIDTADKMMTTAGSLALAGNKANKDAFIVQKLRSAGAIILGKTNLSEFANFRSTRSTSGWSSRGGQTKNPYILDRNPCGSSSGTGTAVSANLCAIGIGTETNGSIACPSSINGLVGIKPTVGLWSRSGIIPISHTQDTAGPMTRTVSDAAILLGICVGEDPNDPKTLQSKFEKDYSIHLDTTSLKGKKIGIDKDAMKGNEDVAAIFEQAIKQMKSLGADIIEIDFTTRLKTMGNGEHEVLCHEFKYGLNKYLNTANAPVKNLDDIIKYNKEHAEKAMPYFKQELLEESNSKGDLESPVYTEALKKILDTTSAAIDDCMKQYQLDAILSPGDGPSWCTDLVNGDAFFGNSYYWPAAICGYPHISVPMGFVHGLPVGLCFIGERWSEGKLIGFAYAYEQISKSRKPPKFLNKVV